MELLTPEQLGQRLGKDGLKLVLAWLEHLCIEQKHRTILCEDDLTLGEKHKAQQLMGMAQSIRSLINNAK